jgi:hypothetical protein
MKELDLLLLRYLEHDYPAAPPADRAARASALARSPRLVARWQARRRETVDAVRAGLGAGWLGEAGAQAGQDRALLARLLHKLAGTAAMFGEPALGIAASALERALAGGADGARCDQLARALLAEADAPAAPG